MDKPIKLRWKKDTESKWRVWLLVGTGYSCTLDLGMWKVLKAGAYLGEHKYIDGAKRIAEAFVKTRLTMDKPMTAMEAAPLRERAFRIFNSMRCYICNSIEGCDHTVRERLDAWENHLSAIAAPEGEKP